VTPGTLWLGVLERSVSIQCDDAAARDALACVHGGMRGVRPRAGADLEYRVDRAGEGFSVRRGAEELGRARSTEELVFVLEQDLLVEIQRARPDLYFIHSAALEHEGRAVLLVAESGGGKTTTAWALLHHGFRYGSDELAPVEPLTGRVHAFPRAPCLKWDPPGSYPLPPGTIRTPRTRRVPVEGLPAPRARFPAPLAAIYFVHYRRGTIAPSIRELGSAEAGARLFAQAMNGLAHPREGLDAAIDIASRGRCFSLESGDLVATSRLLLSTCP
jgi:hypothetical protein